MALQIGSERVTKTEFLERRGITVRNIRWSWTGVDQKGDLVLFVWHDKRKRDEDGGKEWVEILNPESATRLGGKERQEMLEAKTEKQKVWLVVQDRPIDPTKGPSVTTSIDPRIYEGGCLKKGSDGVWWIEILPSSR